MIAITLLLASQALSFTADRIAADNVTHALAASGHIVAVAAPATIRSEYMMKDADGLMKFYDPTYVTTCSNELGHTHWNVTGELEYKDGDHVVLRNVWLNFYEIPIFWIPYMYYPLDTKCGFSWMPGYTGRWGGFMLTRYKYNLIGKKDESDMSAWLDGATRFDLRYRQGIALGEELDWGLGELGRGGVNLYYAWDEDQGRYNERRRSSHNPYTWGSDVDRDRYAIEFDHRWDPSERDSVMVRAGYYSDSYVRSDFFRRSAFNWKSQWLGYENSGVFWEHLEESFSAGVEASGRLNDFYGMTDRLPELYFDVNPQPLFGLPINYETQSRIGYLRRNPAEYGPGGDPLFAHNPGRWAEYEAFRLDTYHRLTAPFKTMNDTLSVVPRIGYHGTYWNESGYNEFSGLESARDAGDVLRSILEGGVTFAGRGTGWVDDKWRHMIEPYADVLAQHAWMSGLKDGTRPYVFDNIDSSMIWEDQFAGRARNLPYTYYGVTPGVRNAWDKLDERGTLRQIVDFDVYAAFQFGDTSYESDEDSGRKLAEAGKPNYGNHDCFVTPGARLRWTPADDLMFLARVEYDSDHNSIPLADAGFQHAVSKTFKYNAKYLVRDYRMWDFSTTPHEDFDDAKFHYVQLGFERQPLDWFAWGPYVRWDIRENDLDGIGTWFDFLTDCLGFRFIVEYDNSYTMIDGYERDEDWSFGFYIYLRALGADSANIFSRR